MEQLLKELNINLKGELSEDGSYVVNIPNSEEFGRIYSKLEKSNILDEVEDSTIMTLMNVSLMYRSEDFIVNLLADIGEDLYKLVINEL